MNGCNSFNIGRINTKRENAANFNVLLLTFSELEFLNGCISLSTGSINTKLENAADFNVLFLTKWVSCCLSYNKGLIPSPSRFETRQ